MRAFVRTILTRGGAVGTSGFLERITVAYGAHEEQETIRIV
jgi:hypothetical protein